MSVMLTPDAQVPSLRVPTLSGDTWNLAEQSPENFTMLVFYRGLHCPVCKAYLQKLEGLLDAYEASGFSTIAISMNDEETARKTASEWDLDKIAIGYGLSDTDARAWGFMSPKQSKKWRRTSSVNRDYFGFGRMDACISPTFPTCHGHALTWNFCTQRSPLRLKTNIPHAAATDTVYAVAARR